VESLTVTTSALGLASVSILDRLPSS